MKFFFTFLCVVFLSITTIAEDTFHFDELGQLPVLYDGRLQPFDSLARFGLIIIKEKTSFKRVVNNEEQSISPIQWLFEVLVQQPAVFDDPIFLIHDPAIKHELKLPDQEKYFSYNQLSEFYFTLLSKAEQYNQLDEKTVYETNVIQITSKLSLFTAFLHGFIPFKDIDFNLYIQNYTTSLQTSLPLFYEYNQTGELASEQENLQLIEFNQFFKQHRQFSELSTIYLYPSLDNVSDTSLWSNTGSELLKQLDTTYSVSPILVNYGLLSSAYKTNDVGSFNDAVNYQLDLFKQALEFTQTRISFEYYFNQLNPFFWAMFGYVLVMLVMFVFYITNSAMLYKAATWLCYSAFMVHTFGLFARMFIQFRPPVTNLYSSAVFVGWVAIGLSLFLEKIFKNKLSNMIASILGFSTLIIAHHLALQGDTLEQMQAVLDSNFWLSTHVITITLGYGGTFLAGGIATVYVFHTLLKTISKELDTQYFKMTYAIICFSLFFSFIGTILGGIWADQSWGRFWGWDPKENGALLIVLWNAFILHAKLAKLVHTKGVMLMSIFGNIVTAFAWFGVNMLGVGLHSYGFMNEMFNWLIGYSVIQLGLILIGMNRDFIRGFFK